MNIRFAFSRFAFCAAILNAGVASADCQSQQWGNTVYHSCSDGRSGTSTTWGNTTYHSFGGQTGTSTDYGLGTSYHSFSNGQSGTSRKEDSTTHHSFGGNNVTSTTMGNSTYHNMGSYGTSRSIGGTTYHNRTYGRGDISDIAR